LGCGNDFAQVVSIQMPSPASLTIGVIPDPTTHELYGYLAQELRWGGDCPGQYEVSCQTTSPGLPDPKTFTWSNNEGETQTAYFIVSGSDGVDHQPGIFTLAWALT
jgi:hypothetical protein